MTQNKKQVISINDNSVENIAKIVAEKVCEKKIENCTISVRTKLVTGKINEVEIVLVKIGKCIELQVNKDKTNANLVGLPLNSFIDILKTNLKQALSKYDYKGTLKLTNNSGLDISLQCCCRKAKVESVCSK